MKEKESKIIINVPLQKHKYLLTFYFVDVRLT